MSKASKREARKQYLTEFLCEFDYADGAKAALLEAFDRVFASEEDERLFEEIRIRFEGDPDEKYPYLIERADALAEKHSVNAYTVYLLVLILLSESSKTIYAKRGLSLEMWRSNMFDLKYRCDNLILVKGVYGTDCPEWYRRFFAATRFTFGKLQFETGLLGKDCEVAGRELKADDTAVFIHIPRSGDRLTPESVDAATREAAAFYEKRCGIRDPIFACHSWILYPENKTILSETSNLYSFISRFDIVDVEEDTSYKELWRLFDKEYTGNADDLPQDTSLRRAYAKRVKEHKPLGVALGVWVYRP